MKCYHRRITWALAVLFAIGSLAPSSVSAGDLLKSLFRGPTTPKSPSVEQLAQEIDWLERHIEQYGSVVCKQPDVWGQARLTKHREEYEQQMLAQLGGFDLLINATIDRSDQAFFSNSFALQAAIDGRQATILNPVTGSRSVISQSDANTMATHVMNILPAPTVSSTTTTSAQQPTIFASQPNGLTLGNFGGNITKTGIALEPTIALDQRSRFIQHLHELRRINEGDDTADSPGYALNLVRIPVSVLPGRATREGYGAEVTVTMTPYLSDSLLPTTFRSLVLNDLVRQLALPMTRLVETKSWTLNEELRKKTQDIQKRLADVRAKKEALLKEQADSQKIIAEYQSIQNTLTAAENASVELDVTKYETIGTFTKAKKLDLQGLYGLRAELAMEVDGATKVAELKPFISEAEKLANQQRIPNAVIESAPTIAKMLPMSATFADAKNLRASTDRKLADYQIQLIQREASIRQYEANEKQLNEEAGAITRAFGKSTTPALPISRTRRSLSPLPASQIRQIYSDDQLEAIAYKLDLAYQGRNIRWNDDCPDKEKKGPDCYDNVPRSQGRVLVTDAELFLQAELEAAYECYAKIPEKDLIEIISNCKLAERIRIGDFENVRKIREHFEANVLGKLAAACSEKCPPLTADLQSAEPKMAGLFGESQLVSAEAIPLPAAADESKPKEPKCPPEPKTSDALHALVWAIVVESALLSEHLTGDIRNTAQAKGCPCGDGMEHYFYLAQPRVETCLAFNEYVRCRWPIHVFALDPVTQDQNVADAFGRRRELQLAASLAFVSGRISAANLSRFVRRLEADYETVSLNRTVVGFSHGEDTFGWRFAPRFQTPPPASGALCAFTETLFGGPSPESELLKRNIEPGMRECVAVVIMPSFVPYVTMDVRSNWYRLNHHHGWLPTRHNTEQSMTDVMKLSRAVQSMHHTAAAVCDAGQYRSGEVERLMRRVQQLDRELPLQSMQVQIPIENTLGGFAMFNNGVTDLAPELDGWHGGPGINPHGETTLFLVGDHYSVHHTLVIAGDKPVSDVTMLSRQILQVKIPAGVKTNQVDGDEYVDVHVATPYGVTGHLHVPVDRKESASFQSSLIWSPGDFSANYEITPAKPATDSTPATNTTIEVKTFDRNSFTLRLPAAATQLPAAKVNLALSLYAEGNVFLGNVSVSDVQFDPQTGAYVVTGAQFGTLTTDIKAALDPYVAFLLEHSPTGGATLGDISIAILGQAVSSDAKAPLSTLRLTLKKK